MHPPEEASLDIANETALLQKDLASSALNLSL